MDLLLLLVYFLLIGIPVLALAWLIVLGWSKMQVDKDSET